MKTFSYGHDRLTASLALSLARGQIKGKISPAVRAKILASQKAVEDIVASGRTVYGVNTGFGPLCNTAISAQDTRMLQTNILRSHAVGMGQPVSPELTRLMLILKLHGLSFGYSGVRLETLRRLAWHLDQDVIPVVPEQGSVGASGDLAPLAHLFLPLIGLGQVWVGEKRVPTAKLLQQHGLKPLDLGPKEGLALINGTQFIAAHAVCAVTRLFNCLEAADLIGAMTVEGLLGSARPFEARLHKLRPFRGAQIVGHRLSQLLKGSEMVASHADCGRVQDPYSMRCMPQVHGTSRDAWAHLNTQLVTELNSVTDNPIIFNARDTISGGLFHGQALALPLDYTSLAASELGSISERRTYLLLEGRVGLPVLLMKDTGVNSGFMIAQYLAAALASENKTDCFPASADSIPTSLGQEDHVSMGSISGRKCLRIIGNLEKILGVELLCAAQAFDFRRPLHSTPVLEACQKMLRSHVTHAVADRVFCEDLEKTARVVASGELVACANAAARRHGIDLRGNFGAPDEL
jgi:histidine ammonia-lyase